MSMTIVSDEQAMRTRNAQPDAATMQTAMHTVAAMTLEVWRLTWRQTPRTVADLAALPGPQVGRNPSFTDWTTLGGLVVSDS